MFRSSFLLASLFVASLAACAVPTDDAPITKADARAQASKADNGFDFCEAFDWYGDGICDDFCANPDPDCAGDQYCYSDSDCVSGEACNADELCLSPCGPGEICPAVCAGFCVEAPAPDECWGAWSDQFGTCRTPADGVYPDSCCATDVCGGFANLPCDDGEFCRFGEPPAEAAADLTGLCMPKPEACLEIFAPVCGLNGITYDNACSANMDGTDVGHEGACDAPEPAMCGGFANIPCASSDDWCSFGEVPTGASADMSGVCLARPQACTFEFAPVCGRDGQTYSNACFANAGGVDAIADGACE